jgi:hypothetical protein
MISGTLITWAKRGGKESPETLWQIICNLIQEMHSFFILMTICRCGSFQLQEILEL